MRTSKDYDDMIARYEQQLKEWKAKRRKIKTAEERRAKAEAEEQYQKELLEKGRQVEEYRRWMRMTSTPWEDRIITVLDLYEETKDEPGFRFIGDLPDCLSDPVGHQGAKATKPEA